MHCFLDPGKVLVSMKSTHSTDTEGKTIPKKKPGGEGGREVEGRGGDGDMVFLMCRRLHEIQSSLLA